MTTDTYLDRTGWPAGPWDQEPDRVEWRDESTKLPCIARRAITSGAWCGDVAVPPGHPWHGLDYDSVPASVHGGLTYAAPCAEHEEHGLCHVPAAGEPADVHWLGFDCAHAGDQTPVMMRAVGGLVASVMRRLSASYRTLAYVQNECASLARQIQAVQNPDRQP